MSTSDPRGEELTAALSDEAAARVRELVTKHGAGLRPTTALGRACLPPTPENVAVVEAFITEAAESADDRPESDDGDDEPEWLDDGTLVLDGDEYGPYPEPPTADEVAVPDGWSWHDLDWAAHAETFESFLYEHTQTDQWMPWRKGKKPFAPWGDPDHPDGDPDIDSRYQWSIRDHLSDLETAMKGLDDPRVEGLAYVQQAPEPLMYVDGDDVRCPETGEVHPVMLDFLDDLGPTYGDVSDSRGGIHAVYRGNDVPGRGSQAVFVIDDEPWGAHADADDPDLPKIEIYPMRRVYIATGRQVKGTPDRAAPLDEAALERWMREYDAYREEREPSSAGASGGGAARRAAYDLSDYEPTATTATEVTSDIRDVFAALDRLRPSDLGMQTTQNGVRGGWPAYDPPYRESTTGESLHRPTGGGPFYDQASGDTFGILALLAYEEGIIDHPADRLHGEAWGDALDLARDRSGAIPVYIPDASASEHGQTPVWALVKAALTLDLAARTDLIARTTDDGSTYEALPPCAYNATLEALEAAGVDHGREHIAGVEPGPTVSIASGLELTGRGATAEERAAWLDGG